MATGEKNYKAPTTISLLSLKLKSLSVSVTKSQKFSFMASSTSSSKYEVFLSFRGEDTRRNFTSHLFAALSKKKIETFIDKNLKRGDEISPSLLKAIEGSTISVVIFSKDYASSKWCLDELVKILECKKIKRQIVIPVFFDIYPSDVRKQTGSFGAAFVEHENNFSEMPGKAQKWRDALTEASYLSGYESTKFGDEAELVGVIVKDVLKKLEDRITVSNDFSGLVGINSRIEGVKSLLSFGLSDFQVVGIWGMGGIGKTTLAEAVFKQVSGDFDGKFFMVNIREKLEKGSGLSHLQKEVFSHLLDENLEKEGLNIPLHTMLRLQRMKVFLVLDDVNECEQLQSLVGAGGLRQFRPGSRVIVTTRDKQVLVEYGVNRIYEVEGFNYHEAHQHFCNFAFRQNNCPDDLMELSNKVIDYAKGNPLALRVLGSFLHAKNKQDWENALHNLKRISGPSIYKVLKISYNDLDWEVKNIFLDIACFFKGEDEDHVISFFDDHHLMHYGLSVLVEKSLITISHKKLEMHDLLQEMGQEIVRQESQEKPGNRSRLWDPKDVYQVLTKNQGTDSIKGIFLNMSRIRDIHLDSKVFENMPNLRLLDFFVDERDSHVRPKVLLPQGLDYLSDELRYLHWHGYPGMTLPMNFNPHNLIQLGLPYSEVQQLWEGRKEAFKLKSIDLHDSQHFARIPEPSETPNVERIILDNCQKFSCVPSSVQIFNKLGLLCFKDCRSLSWFPRYDFRSPIKIYFTSCISLTKFPAISGNVIELVLSGTGIVEVPSSIESLTSLQKLNVGSCESLKSISTSICKLKSLRSLDLSYCSEFKNFPEILEPMENLKCVNLQGTSIKMLPRSIELLIGLRKLNFRDCYKLDSLPESLGNLKSLEFIEGDGGYTKLDKRRGLGLPLVSGLSNLIEGDGGYTQLEELKFDKHRGFVLLPLSGLSNLKVMRLSGCKIIEIPQDIGCLRSLNSIDLSENSFENLPTSIKQLSQLRHLSLMKCNRLQSLPELPLNLIILDARYCQQLESLPELPDCLEILDTSLLKVTISQSSNKFSSTRLEYKFDGCWKLNEINILADSQLRIRYMAIALLKLFHFFEKESGEVSGIKGDESDNDSDDVSFIEKKLAGFDIRLPGSGAGIPDWFSNRRSGSSITIQLPEHCHNKNFIGFAICVVCGSKNRVRCSWTPEFWKYRIHFEIKTLSTTEHFDLNRTFNYTLNGSNTVFLGFDPCWDVRLPDGDHNTTVSFYFFIVSRRVWVECCAVCPVFAHPTESPPHTFTVNMVPPTEDKYTQIMKIHNDLHYKASTSGNMGTPDEHEELSYHLIKRLKRGDKGPSNSFKL